MAFDAATAQPKRWHVCRHARVDHLFGCAVPWLIISLVPHAPGRRLDAPP